MRSRIVRGSKSSFGLGFVPQVEAIERRLFLSAYTLSNIASFGGENGANPTAAVTVDANGNLYGTTSRGGNSVFEIGRGSNTITTLASLGRGSPQGAVTLDAAGNLYGTTQFDGTHGQGSIFEIAHGSNTATTLVSLDFADGTEPRTPLTMDPSGNLYGTTTYYGANPSSPGYGSGTVFEIAKGSATLTVLATFNFTDGSAPDSPLTLDASGNLYGTTSSGGAYHAGVVFEVAKGSNAVTDLATFNGANGSGPAGALALDGAGNLYGTTTAGGASGYGAAFELANGVGAVTDIASFNNSNGADPEGGLTIDPAGNLFGTTFAGGQNGGGTVFEIAKGTTAITTLTSFSQPVGYQPAARVTLDALGNLFGTTEFGGGDGSVFKLTPNTAVTLSLTAGANPSTVGQPLTFNVSVTGGVPDGETVTLLDAGDNDAVVATGTLLDGSATLTVLGKRLGVGTHKLIAVYAGDAGHGASESAPFVQTVLPSRPGRTP